MDLIHEDTHDTSESEADKMRRNQVVRKRDHLEKVYALCFRVESRIVSIVYLLQVLYKQVT